MGSDDTKTDEFIEEYKTQLASIDTSVQLILGSHFDVEKHLDDFLDEVFFHPIYIENAGLGFRAKTYIARACSDLGHERPEWRLMLALNSLRNKVAHRSTRKELKVSLGEFRKGLIELKLIGVEVERLGHHDLIVHAAAVCSGYLINMRDQWRELQGKAPIDD
jgi:hypothetical protein